MWLAVSTASWVRKQLEKKAKQNKETSIFPFPLGNKMQSRVGDIQG